MKEKVKIFFSKLANFVKANKLFFIGFIVIAFFLFIVTFCMDLINTSEYMFSDSIIGSGTLSEKANNFGNFWNNMFINNKFLINYLLCVFLFSCFYGLTNRPRLSCIITAILTLGFELINYLVIQARGFAVTVADIYAIRTAMSVAGGISFKVKADVIIALILISLAFIILFLFFKPDKNKKGNWIQRIIKGICFFAAGSIGTVLIFTLPVLDEMLIWDVNSCYANYGSALTIVKMFKDINVKKPDGYMKDQIEEYIASFADDTQNLNEEEKNDLPNVVVIMNESFTDLNLAYDISQEKENLEYFHELMNSPKTVSGIMHSSKLGGGTSSVEYEFLTQNTTAFLPVGSIPYQQYIRSNVSESMVERFHRLNFTTHGIHSYYNTGYSRGKVYKLLGFDDIKFLGDMPELELTHNNYPTDSSTYKYLYSSIPKEADNKKDFTFVLTMQNHIAYAYDETGEEYYPDDYFTNIYMQEQKMTDDALRELINYFENVEEDTVVLFFGDHQPSLNQNEIFKIKDDVAEEEANYIVPFFIWANFDLNVKKNVETSTNYLQSILYEAANIPTDSYTKYIQELRKEVPVLTCNYYKGADGQTYLLNDTDSPYFNDILRYNQICYYHLFEK